MNSLIALCADYYWEQDTTGRFTRLDGTRADSDGGLSRAALGKAPWALPGLTATSLAWSELQDLVAQRASFRDIEWRWQATPAQTLLLSVCGEPVFDGAGAFAGYRGVMRDLTAQRRQLDELRRFRAAIEMSGDPIFLIDRETMRFIDMNAAACDAGGYARDELLAMGPHDLLLCGRAALEADYDAAIAAGRRGTITEGASRNRAGEVRWYEMRRRAIRFEGSWVIVSVSRDITRRKLAEESALRIGQMYAAISGTNEAILHARTPDELYRQVCEVAVRGGPIVSASVLLHEPDSEWAKTAAAAGIGVDTVRAARVSFADNRPEGHGMVGTAFRSRQACIINDIASDPRMQPWREAHGREAAAAGAAFPLAGSRGPTGVLLLYSRVKDAFDAEIVQLLERMAQNITFALDNFEREAERQQALDALRESEEKYRSILENMNDGYFEIDLKGTYTVVNEALCRLHACTREEALGLNYRDYMDPATAARIFQVFNQVFRTGQPGELTEYPVRRQDGSGCIAQTSVQLIVGADSMPAGFRGISRDITARHQAQAALRASEERYHSILESIEEVYYEVDLAGTLLHCNDAFCRMFGYTLDELIGLNYADYHHPEDAPFVYAQFNEVYRTGIPKKGIDWRLVHKSGERLLCEGSIHLVRNAQGEPAGFRGMLRDVTQRRAMEAALRQSEERFRDLTELSSDWYWEQDSRYRFVQINGDVLGKTGMAAEGYLGKTLWELPFDAMSAEQWSELKGRLDAALPFYELVLKTEAADGAPRYLSISGLPVAGADGRLRGYRGTGKDITERTVAEERIRHLASHDILTGLPNRMMFNQMLSYQVQQAQRYARRFALMFIDLDGFKAVNDNFGHHAGDVLLKETARRLTDSVRASDFVARLAGDEFVVIIQEPGEPEQLTSIARKVVAAVRAPVALGDATHHVTASAGVCIFPDHGSDEEALLRHADAAMYRVKRGSKDSFEFYLR